MRDIDKSVEIRGELNLRTTAVQKGYTFCVLIILIEDKYKLRFENVCHSLPKFTKISLDSVLE